MAQQLPLPDPKRIKESSPEHKVLGAGAILWRIHETTGRHAAAWNAFRHAGPTSARFDPHLELSGKDRWSLQKRGVLYASVKVASAAFAEAFQDTQVIAVQGERRRRLAGFRLAAELRLLDLTGSWPLMAGGNQAINSGSRRRARQWSRIIYEVFPRLDGLYYPSSLNGKWRCVALFERAAGALPKSPELNRALDDEALLRIVLRAARDSGYTLGR